MAKLTDILTAIAAAAADAKDTDAYGSAADFRDGQLAKMAGAYALAAHGRIQEARAMWPWDIARNPMQELTTREAMLHAAGLLVLEVARIDRAGARHAR